MYMYTLVILFNWVPVLFIDDSANKTALSSEIILDCGITSPIEMDMEQDCGISSSFQVEILWSFLGLF